jgi:uncharacterized cupredoxin-like copper-binding protein
MRTLSIALACLIALSACPSRRSADESQSGPPKSSTAVGNPQTVPENSTAMNPVLAPESQMKSRRAPEPAAPAVHVQLTDYSIEMPEAITAGPHPFTITNAGKQNHNFAIEGPGVSTKLASDLTRGDSAQMTLNLPKGTYTVYCPVDEHRGKGMQRTLTVQ